MAKHAEHNLGKILSICVFQDKVLLMCNRKPMQTHKVEMPHLIRVL
jgi:hypothetical protein